jgi:hypothetical protein
MLPGGGIANPAQPGVNPAGTAAMGSGLSRFNSPGKRPARGKENTTRN